jgi:hypothetical protein
MGSRCSGILQKGWKLDYNSDFWPFLYTELFDAYFIFNKVYFYGLWNPL